MIGSWSLHFEDGREQSVAQRDNHREVRLQLVDDDTLRGFLGNCFPGFTVDGVPSPSGQRVVYFCHFDPSTCTQEGWAEWGNVVLKVSEGVSAPVIAYMQREIDVLKRLNARGFPSLLYDEVIAVDPGTEEKLQYLRFITIEERIDALPLNEVVQNYRTEEAVLGLLHQLVTILSTLWNSKPPLVHRDLKPPNILIGPDGCVVVIDLGIMREEGAVGVTHTEAAWGPCTPEYASPEQCVNDKRNISYRSDFFALGVLCYGLLAGRNPFYDGKQNTYEVFHNVCNMNPPTLFELGVCSSAMSNLVMRMMEKQPYKRHRRIEDLLEELSNVRGV